MNPDAKDPDLTAIVLVACCCSGISRHSYLDRRVAPWTSAQLPGFGTASQIATQAFALENRQAEIEVMPWKDAYNQAKQGKFQATLGWIYNKQRAKDFLYSVPVFRTNYYWFYRKDSPKAPFNWEELDKHKGLRVGITRGYFYGKEFDELKEKGSLTLIEADSDEENFQKLLAGSIDLFPHNLCVGYYQLRYTFVETMTEITHSPFAFSVNNLHLLFNRVSADSPKLLEIFNRGMTKLSKQESFKKTQNKCFRNWKMGT
ncbi:substrate-binding periplasmic protein [Dongshaea marina]|uniref:substrate-binding periplasmic protein n=1 Tax=Dongshaea marina TaxID=2047966 RepID=UPI000D3E9008|nr:transporter substrate-binding domain-containing protein [Dongshaea marina]